MSEETLFHEALAKPAGERASFLDAACAGDAGLRQRLEILLRAHDNPGSFLGSPAVNPEATSAPLPGSAPEEAVAPALVSGSVVGPYKLVQEIGEGGMGTVWMAQQQEPVKRLVALKVIKPGMDSRQVIARFEAERQALALMDHPSIARVLDGGTTGAGRPYFVMDLVKGVPITRYCDEHHLTPRQRLELFLPVCQAIQHAHQKGIIHRDIKPSNVLVALYDGKPVPKVIDFGVAKAAGQSLTEKTLVTGFGNIVGTLEYMSPEQAEINQLDIDTRADIYSLGVLLYELLAGSPPFTRKELEKAGMLEMLRVIREQEPSRPSTKLSTADGLPTLAANRGTEPAKLTRLVRGELDWIVMKALEKDRSRRYETANGFAMDVQRYLADEPVLACPPSAGYRLRKFARRNKPALSMAAVLALAVLAVAGTLGWVIRDRGARRTRLANDFELAVERAELFHSEGKRAEALAAFERAEALVGEASLGSALQHKLVGLRERLDAEARDQEFVAQFEEYRLLEQTQVDEKSNRFSYTGAAVHKALKRYGIEPGVTDLAQAVARIRGRPEAIQAQLLAALQDHLNHTPKDVGSTREWLIAALDSADRDPWRTQVRRARNAGNMPALEKLVREVNVQEQPASFLLWIAASWGLNSGTPHLKLLRRIHRAYPNDIWANVNLALALDTAGQPAEAVRYCTAALALRPRNPGILFNRGNALRMAGEIDAAIADYAQAITLAPRYRVAHICLGQLLHKQGKLNEATLCYRKAIELKPDYFNTHGYLGNLLEQQGKLDEALAARRKAIEHNPNSAEAYFTLGITLAHRNQLDDAVAAYRKAIELKSDYVDAHYNLGSRLTQQGRLAEAAVAFRRVIEISPKDAEAHCELGAILHRQKKPVEAIGACRRAIELKPDSVTAHRYLGFILHGQNRLDEAAATYRKALTLQPNNLEVHVNLADVLLRQRQPSAAAAAFRTAIQLAPDHVEAHFGLATALKAQGRLSEAADVYRAGIKLKPDYAELHCNRGLLLQQLGQFPDALVALRRGHELGSKRPGWPYPSGQWVQECQRYLHLEAKLPAMLRGEQTPSREEASDLVQLCLWKRRYAAAAGFAAKVYTDRTEPPRLGAFAAARAGCGQSEDAAELSDKERARLRGQALEWLRADMAAWKARLATGKPQEREAAQRFVDECLYGPSLAALREASTLELLPAAERQEWRRFWAEIATASPDKASDRP
jgi:serine/threonine protein kinase/Flp pilus assembly protein TadD